MKLSKQVAPKRSDISTAVVAQSHRIEETQDFQQKLRSAPLPPFSPTPRIPRFFFSPNTEGSDVRRMWAVPRGSALEWSKFKGVDHVGWGSTSRVCFR